MMDLRNIYVGNEPLAFIRKGENVVFPEPIRDGLVLWYDFAGRRNTDVNRAVAVDLSNNGNHGELMNFAFEEGSGYLEGSGNSGG